jgi:pre-60S factor REI1
MASKKHQERESKYAASKAVAAAAPPEETHAEPKVDEDVAMKADNVEDTNDVESASVPGPSNPTAVETAPRLLVSEDADEEEIGLSIEAKIAAARNRLTTSHCLFCSHAASSIDENLSHMASAHSFFIPDQDYLVDLPGLLTYLGEKVSIGNTCLYCPNGGKEFGSLEAVRAHMRDKGHCKIAYDTDDQKLEVSDYYDFESSYPDVEERKARRAERRQRKADEKRRKEQEQREAAGAVEGDEWEEMDVDDDAEADEVVVIEGSESEEDDSDIESELVSCALRYVSHRHPIKLTPRSPCTSLPNLEVYPSPQTVSPYASRPAALSATVPSESTTTKTSVLSLWNPSRTPAPR